MAIWLMYEAHWVQDTRDIYIYIKICAVHTSNVGTYDFVCHIHSKHIYATTRVVCI